MAVLRIKKRIVFLLKFCLAYLRIIYEKTKGQVPLGPLMGKQNIQGLLIVEAHALCVTNLVEQCGISCHLVV